MIAKLNVGTFLLGQRTREFILLDLRGRLCRVKRVFDMTEYNNNNKKEHIYGLERSSLRIGNRIYVEQSAAHSISFWLKLPRFDLDVWAKSERRLYFIPEMTKWMRT